MYPIFSIHYITNKIAEYIGCLLRVKRQIFNWGFYIKRNNFLLVNLPKPIVGLLRLVLQSIRLQNSITSILVAVI